MVDMQERLKPNRYGVLILAGGLGLRLGRVDKALLDFNGEPLLARIVKKTVKISSHIVVSVCKDADVNVYQKTLPVQVEFVRDEVKEAGPLEGIRQGMKKLGENGVEYALTLACDLPLVNLEVLRAMLEKAERLGAEALIPRWPNGYIEPLHAVYKPKVMHKAASEALASGERLIVDAIKRLSRIFYIDVDELRRFDPQLKTFTNINTWEDMRKALNEAG